MKATDLPVKFWERVTKSDDCWTWHGACGSPCPKCGKPCWVNHSREAWRPDLAWEGPQLCVHHDAPYNDKLEAYHYWPTSEPERVLSALRGRTP